MTTRLLDLIPRLGANDNKIVGGGGKANNRNLSKKSKNIKFKIHTRTKAMREPQFLTPGVKKTFNQLK